MKSKHQEEFEKLDIIENELINIISNIGNEMLIDKFIKYQEQKNICNKTFVSELEKMI